MANKALETVSLRNEFYRDNFRRIAFVLMMSLVLNIGLGYSTYYFYQAQPAKQYFAATASGNIIPIRPLDQPILSDASITSWISNAVANIYRLDFINYRQDLSVNRKYFTDAGWSNFNAAFQPTLNKIISDKLVVKATPSNVPVIIKKFLYNGVYTWQVQVPLLVSYAKGASQNTSNIVWTIAIQRVATSTTDQLLGISQIVQN